MITRIRVQNYRSLIDVDVQLEPLTVLIGRSGTGKSNFVGAIRALRDVLVGGNTGIWLANRPFLTPLASLHYSIELKAPNQSEVYSYELIADQDCVLNHQYHPPLLERLSCDGNVVFQKERREWIVEPAVMPEPSTLGIALRMLNGIREVSIVLHLLTRGIGCYDFPGNVMQGPSAPNGAAAGYADDGQNYLATTTAILDDIGRYNEWLSMTRTLSTLNPAITAVDIASPNRDDLRLAYRGKNGVVLSNTRLESEGFRRFFATLLALYQSPHKPLAIFEHPEHAIHPGALETLANEFKRHVKRNRGQVILTTHNPQFLDYFEPEQIRVVTSAHHETKIGPLASDQLAAIRDNLLNPGELLTVDPARLEGQLDEVFS